MFGAAVVAAAVSRLVRAAAGRLPQARSGERSLHEGAIPRAGGLSILAGAVAACMLAPPALPGPAVAWAIALASVALVSWVDDVRGLPALVRLATQALAAALVAWACVGLAPAWLFAVIAIAIVWGANLFNFMDGSDGLAAAMAIIGFAAYAAAAAIAGAPAGAYAGVAAACVPFFVLNRPPARMFMGDCGSVPLGFGAAAAGAAGILLGYWPSWFPVLVFLPFIADATLTLARRLVRGDNLLVAHRGHYYQRLNLAGAGHRGTLAIYAASMLACACLALACLAFAPGRGPAALALALLGHAAGFALIDYHARTPRPRKR